MSFPSTITPYKTDAIPTQQDATAATSERLDWLLTEEPPEDAAKSTGKGGRADALANELLVELGKNLWMVALGSRELVLGSDVRLSGAHRARIVDSASPVRDANELRVALAATKMASPGRAGTGRAPSTSMRTSMAMLPSDGRTVASTPGSAVIFWASAR